MLPKDPKCADCKFRDQGIGFVPGEGPEGAKLIAIGEAPGKQEVANGRPFRSDAPAGGLLTQLLREVDVDRADIYLTNAVKCARPGFKNPTLPWIRECRKRHLDLELQARSPNLVALFGNAALAATGVAPKVSGILNWDGSVFALPSGQKVIGMLHPAALVSYSRMRKRMPIERKFYRKLAHHMQYPEVPNPDAKAGLDPNPDPDKLIDWLNTIRQERTPLSYDIENTVHEGFLDCKVLCLGLSDGVWSPCFPMSDDPKYDRVYPVLRGTFKDKHVPMIAQNGVHDESILLLHGFSIAGRRIDTCYLHHAIMPELPHSLTFLNSIYTPVPFYKNETKDPEGASQDMALLALEDPVRLRKYCARDAYSTRLVAVALIEEADKKGRTHFYNTIVEPLIPAVADLQATGIKINRVTREVLASKRQKQVDACARNVISAAGISLNPASRDHLRKLLFETWGYKPKSRTPIRKVATLDEETMKWLLQDQVEEPAHRKAILSMQEYFSLRKEVSTYLKPTNDKKGWRVGSDDRVRAQWSIHGTPTGRLACKRPNLQNIPEDLRGMYVASEGRVLLSADYSAFEQWGMALMSHDEPLLETLRSGRDPHCQNVADIWDIPYDTVMAKYKAGDPEMVQLRKVKKSYVYGSNYGASVKTVYDAMVEDLEEPPAFETVQRIHRLYQMGHPAITTMRSGITQELMKTRTLKGAYGRVRQFLGHPDEIITKGYNFPIQNLAADIMNQVHTQLFRTLGRGIICAQVHDSFLFDVPEERVSVTIPIIRAIMGQPWSFTNWLGHKVEQAFPIELKQGKTWHPMVLV